MRLPGISQHGGFESPGEGPGSDFQVRTWHALTRIPPGETRTYGELAAALGNPGAARAVGGGCHANPVPFVVPCHRVVASGGSLGGFALGPGMKRRLLAAESGQWTLLENA